MRQNFITDILNRPLIRIRVTKARKEFGDDNFQMIEKEAAESTNDLRVMNKNQMLQHFLDRKQLEIGLQAANKLQTL